MAGENSAGGAVPSQGEERFDLLFDFLPTSARVEVERFLVKACAEGLEDGHDLPLLKGILILF